MQAWRLGQCLTRSPSCGDAVPSGQLSGSAPFLMAPEWRSSNSLQSIESVSIQLEMINVSKTSERPLKSTTRHPEHDKQPGWINPQPNRNCMLDPVWHAPSTFAAEIDSYGLKEQYQADAGQLHTSAFCLVQRQGRRYLVRRKGPRGRVITLQHKT